MDLFREGSKYSLPLHQYNIERITLFAITHKEVGLDAIGILETYTNRVYDELFSLVNGLIVLATCNRFEVYIDANNVEKVLGRLRSILGSYFRYGKIVRGFDAIYHLYRVAAGLESRILGEEEILGQVRHAWRYARNKAYTSRLLDMIFHGAILAGIRARRETSISRDVIGYPEAAVRLAKMRMKTFNNLKVLIVGAGKASTRIASILCREATPSSLIIANRSVDRAEKLALKLRRICTNTVVDTLEIEALKNTGLVFDVAFIAIYGGADLSFLSNKAQLVVDISTPPTLAATKGKVYTIMDVEKIVEENARERTKEIPKVEAILREEVRKLGEYIAEKKADSVISIIMRIARKLADEEAAEAKREIHAGRIDGVLEVAFWSYTKKVFRPLILFLREQAAKGNAAILEKIAEHYMKELSRYNNENTQLHSYLT